jgi:hypothetical protein
LRRAYLHSHFLLEELQGVSKSFISQGYGTYEDSKTSRKHFSKKEVGNIRGEEENFNPIEYADF